MPEGDSLLRVARRLQVLVGERVEAESPNPRGLATGVARAVDGRVLERVDAVGKNVLLHFEGGVVVRSHLRMNGRWRVRRRGDPAWRGTPWLVLRGAEWEATQWNGPVLQLGGGAARGLGPDLLAQGTDPAELVIAAAPRRPGAACRRGARRPASRRGHREHVACRGALARRRSRPGRRSQASVTTTCSGRSTWARDAMRVSVTAGVRLVPSTAEPGVAVRAAASRFAPAGSAMPNRTAYWCPACQPITTEREGFEPSTSGLPPVTP